MSTQDRAPSTRHRGRTALRPRAVAGTALAHLVVTLQRVGFWLAICLPFLALALLASGVSTRSEQVAFGVILGCNVVALALGKGHEP